MPHDVLFKKLCKQETLRIGWHLAQGDSRDDFVTDPIGHSDFAYNLDERLIHIIEEVQNDRYRPRHLIEIDIPKSGLSVRPGNVLPIEESVLLHAIVYLLAPLLDKKLDSSVYSYRLHADWKKKLKKNKSLFREMDVDIPFLKKKTIRSISPFEPWYERWPQFEADAYHAYTTEGFTHLTKTDIASYYENINLRILETKVKLLLNRDEEKLLQLLFRILNGWTRVATADRGIPQGCEISAFLANLYLTPLDRELKNYCKNKDAKWFRYVDDIMIFSKTDKNAREAVFVINEELRALQLNLQGSKTEVLSGDDLKMELDKKDSDTVDSACKVAEQLDPSNRLYAKNVTETLIPLSPLASRFTRKLPGSIKNLNGKDNRLFRRLMTAYGMCGRPRLRNAALSALKELPDLRILRKSLIHLSRMEYKTHENTLGNIMGFVENDDLPFPYQVGIVFETMVYLHPKKPKSLPPRIRKYITKKRDWVVIQKALEAIMTYPYKPDHSKALSKRFLKPEYHPLVRRAACVLMLRSSKQYVQNELEKLIQQPEPNLMRMALYFNRFITDNDFAVKEISRIRQREKSDYIFIRSLPQFYAIAASNSSPSVEALYKFIKSWPKSKSAKIDWHITNLIKLTNWVIQTPNQAHLPGINGRS